MTPIDYSDKVPEGLTEEVYMYIFRKQMEILRYELYKEITKNHKQMRLYQKEEKSQMYQMMYESVLHKYEPVRKEIYEKVLEVKLEKPQDAKLNMLRAYITFSFKNREADGTPTPDKRHFTDLVEDTIDINKTYVQDMFEGQYPPGIGEDPRLGPNPFKQRAK